jgi:hypothetical protein
MEMPPNEEMVKVVLKAVAPAVVVLGVTILTPIIYISAI